MGFKEDADFARFVSMGAIAADAVRRDLRRYGHDAIELERYAMANKVWQTKVKRLRLPDRVCVRCGLRIESRGKTQLSIVLSHSDAAGRSWDGGGMRDQDLYAFLRVDTTATRPHTSVPVYFRASDLRASSGLAKESSRKAFSEGSELTLTWPSWVPRQSGAFIGKDSSGRLVCRWDNGRSFRYWQWRDWPSRHLYLQPGDPIVADETIVAAVAAPPGDLACPYDWNLRAALSDEDQAERYAAVKVVGILGADDLADLLASMIDNESDWRVRLEAIAGLARMDPDAWTSLLTKIALAAENTDEHRIESVFALSEIATDQAAEALAEIARPYTDKRELRAAAVWGLARGVHPRPDLVMRHVVDPDDFVALHAIAGLTSVTDEMLPTLVNWLNQDERLAAVAAQLLLRQHAVRPLLEAVHRGGHGRLWALRALGDLPREMVRRNGAEMLTREIQEDLEPIWIGHYDWLRDDAAAGLEALDVQKLRFNPLL